MCGDIAFSKSASASASVQNSDSVRVDKVLGGCYNEREKLWRDIGPVFHYTVSVLF